MPPRPVCRRKPPVSHDPQERQFELGCAPRPFFLAVEAVTVSRGIALALVHLHREMHLLHGDMKSANVLVSRDFSLVKVRDQPLAVPILANSAPLRSIRASCVGV
jgi:serine/threonine protein kinase